MGALADNLPDSVGHVTLWPSPAPAADTAAPSTVVPAEVHKALPLTVATAGGNPGKYIAHMSSDSDGTTYSADVGYGSSSKVSCSSGGASTAASWSSPSAAVSTALCASDGLDARRVSQALCTSSGSNLDCPVAGTRAPRKGPSKFSKLKGMLKSAFFVSDAEAKLLKQGRAERLAALEWGLEVETYRSRRDSTQSQWEQGDWQAMHDILAFQMREGERRAGSITISAGKRDRHGWWSVVLRSLPSAKDAGGDQPAAQPHSGAAELPPGIAVAIWYARFDQCSRQAEGPASCACCALGTVRWLLDHPGQLPTQPDVLEVLIREGAQQWRGLCADKALVSRFPDKHFDLDTVLQRQARGAAGGKLTLCRDRSLVGFFTLQGLPAGTMDGLMGGMLSMADIWKAVERQGPALYVVAWNDHFFVLQLAADGRVHLLDSLGSRLHSFCSCAYVLRFEDDADAGLGDAAAGGGCARPLGSALAKAAAFLDRLYAGAALSRLSNDVAAAVAAAAVRGGSWMDHTDVGAIMQQLQVEFHYCLPVGA